MKLAVNDGSPKPVLFLDVDGVINSDPPKLRFLKERGDFSLTEVEGFPIWWSQMVVDFLNMVSAAKLVEIIWLTTWLEKAPNSLAPALGLDDFAVITDISGDRYTRRDALSAQQWWKWKRVVEFLSAGERPVVWLDDELSKGVKTNFYSFFGRERALLISPWANPGLEPEHMDRILNFLKEHQ